MRFPLKQFLITQNSCCTQKFWYSLNLLLLQGKWIQGLRIFILLNLVLREDKKIALCIFYDGRCIYIHIHPSTSHSLLRSGAASPSFDEKRLRLRVNYKNSKLLFLCSTGGDRDILL